jgi:acyl-CoA synthetase (AMP-forming)/AMP-acid ligase II
LVPAQGNSVNIADVLQEHARTRPGHAALIDGGRTIAYRDLDLLVRRSAAHLQALGVGPGSIVGVGLRDTPEHLILLYAVARSGAALLPMDHRWTAEEKRRVAGFFAAALVLREPSDVFSTEVRSIAVDPSWHRSVAAAPLRDDFPSDAGADFCLSLSSGTTGIPKGPMITHRHMAARYVAQRISLGLTPNDRFLVALPLYFGAGRNLTLGAVNNGATLVFRPPPYEADDLVAIVRAQRIDVTLLVPTVLRRLLAIAPAHGHLLPELRLLFSTGAVLHPDERKAVLAHVSANYYNYYGSTEGGGLTLLRPGDTGRVEASVGRPIHAMEVEIVDESDRAVRAGTIGRVRYRGPTIAERFFRNPEASEAAFRDGWFYPGDLGRLDEQGFLYLAGRAKDMIIRGGINIYPEEIEQTLLTDERVGDAAVVGWPSKERGEEIAAFVVRKAEVSERELIDHCRKFLAPYKVPRAVFFLEQLPKSGMGKVIKPQLVERLPPL